MAYRKAYSHLSFSLADWEVMELYKDYRSGVTKSKLAERYRMSYRNIDRLIAKVEQAARDRGLLK